MARYIRVYGHAEQPLERDGMVGPGVYMRITPTISWSWNMAGNPAGDTRYEPRRTVHQIPPRS
jgi:pyridoxamine 5'-phosphate oxidase family protein